MNESRERGYRKKTGEYALTEGQVNKLLSMVGRLDHEVLLRIAIELGLRRADIVSIEQANINLDKKWLVFVEHKKQNKLHWVPLSDSLCKLLEQYLHIVGWRKNKWLFPSSHNPRKHINDKTAWNILNMYLLKANLPQRPFHALRATCIKLCQRKGWSIEQVMKLTNDTFRTIKEHYDIPGEEEMLEVAKEKPLFGE